MTTETLMVSSEQAHFLLVFQFSSEPATVRCLRTYTVNASINGQALGLLVPVNSTRYQASISGLST
ncbi:hypothetical protein, partial [Streptomyces sp. NPDC017638]|uniref:hypothetical protein n=1 Tax=Streptomyces sp. NPDC017638 TaxID=3365004 RepID=UPI0037935887